LPALAAVQMSAIAGVDDDARILELERLINVQYEKAAALDAQIGEDFNERVYQHFHDNKGATPEERRAVWLADPHNVAQEALCEAVHDAFVPADELHQGNV
jgi:hypothetical protein